MRIKPLLGFNKIMARLPAQKLNLEGSLGFKNSLCSSLKKQWKIGAWIIKEAYHLNDISGRGRIMAIVRPSKAGKSNESFMFTHKTPQKAYQTFPRVVSSLVACLTFLAILGLYFPGHFTSYPVVIVVIATASLFLKLLQIHTKWLINLFNGKTCDTNKPDQEISKPHKTSAKLTLIDRDLLFLVDVDRIDSFVISLCILLAWRVLCRLFMFLRSFVTKNFRK